MIREKGSRLDKVEKKMLEFFGQLHILGWMCFVEESIRANHTIIAESFHDAMEMDFEELMVTMVQGVRVDFSPTRINATYSLLDLDNRVYREGFQELGT